MVTSLPETQLTLSPDVPESPQVSPDPHTDPGFAATGRGRIVVYRQRL